MPDELKAIEYTKSMIEKQVKMNKYFVSGMPFSKYQKVYLTTNENIKDYLNIVDFNNKDSALTVLASGDHLYNLISKGVKNIDTFDSNLLTEYLALGLKYAMLKKYSYKEYLSTYSKLININTGLEEITSIINDLIKYMDDKYKNYWQKVINYNYCLQKQNNIDINIIFLLFINFEPVNFIKNGNNFLNSEEEYNKLKNIVDKANITFRNVNAIKLSKVYHNKYDFILLSNILDYFNKYFLLYRKFDTKYLNSYIENLKNILNEDGVIFLKYIFSYATINYKRTNIFWYANIKDKDLKNEELYKIKSLNRQCYDGIVLSKKY